MLAPQPGKHEARLLRRMIPQQPSWTKTASTSTKPQNLMLLWTKTAYSSTAVENLRIIHLPARMNWRAAERLHLRERDIDLRKQIAGWRVRRRCSRSAVNSIVCADECCGSKAGMRAREAFPSGARVLPLPSLPAPWLLRQQCVPPAQQLAEQ